MEWIKVEDKLPKENQKVWYYFKPCGVYLGNYSRIEYPKEATGVDYPVYGDCFHSKHGWLTDDVTHWMPYQAYHDGDIEPQPPMEKDKE